jgi:predicted GNAT family acetyltransferase
MTNTLRAPHPRRYHRPRMMFASSSATTPPGWASICVFRTSKRKWPRCRAPMQSPDGRLFYAERDGQPAGCVGIRPLSAGLCEMKRLYVEPSQRGFGVGRDLTLAAIKAAKEIGYRKLLLDTLPAMRVAVKLYREMGFQGNASLLPDADRRHDVPGPRSAKLVGGRSRQREPLSTSSTSTAPGRVACRRWIRVLHQAVAPANAAVPVDRLLRFARAGERDRRPAAGRDVRASQRRQRRRAHRSQLPVGDPVRRRCRSRSNTSWSSAITAAAASGRRSIATAQDWSTSGCGTCAMCMTSIWRWSMPYRPNSDTIACANSTSSNRWPTSARPFVVQDAWQRGQPLTVHGWIYGLQGRPDARPRLHRASRRRPAAELLSRRSKPCRAERRFPKELEMHDSLLVRLFQRWPSRQYPAAAFESGPSGRRRHRQPTSS